MANSFLGAKSNRTESPWLEGVLTGRDVLLSWGTNEKQNGCLLSARTEVEVTRRVLGRRVASLAVIGFASSTSQSSRTRIPFAHPPTTSLVLWW